MQPCQMVVEADLDVDLRTKYTYGALSFKIVPRQREVNAIMRNASNVQLVGLHQKSHTSEQLTRKTEDSLPPSLKVSKVGGESSIWVWFCLQIACNPQVLPDEWLLQL